jgi:hypothetical protein
MKRLRLHASRDLRKEDIAAPDRKPPPGPVLVGNRYVGPYARSFGVHTLILRKLFPCAALAILLAGTSLVTKPGRISPGTWACLWRIETPC